MSKSERSVHKTSLRPYLDKQLREDVGDGSLSAQISRCIDKYYNPDFGFSKEYLSKLIEVAKKEKRDPEDLIRVIVEEHLDKVKYIRTFL